MIKYIFDEFFLDYMSSTQFLKTKNLFLMAILVLKIKKLFGLMLINTLTSLWTQKRFQKI